MLFQESGRKRASKAVWGTGVLLPSAWVALISGGPWRQAAKLKKAAIQKVIAELESGLEG